MYFLIKHANKKRCDLLVTQSGIDPSEVLHSPSISRISSRFKEGIQATKQTTVFHTKINMKHFQYNSYYSYHTIYMEITLLTLF